jgi:hypothetical protein
MLSPGQRGLVIITISLNFQISSSKTGALLVWGLVGFKLLTVQFLGSKINYY